MTTYLDISTNTNVYLVPLAKVLVTYANIAEYFHRYQHLLPLAKVSVTYADIAGYFHRYRYLVSFAKVSVTGDTYFFIVH